MPPYPHKAPIIYISPPYDPNILVQVDNKPLIGQLDSPTSIGSSQLCYPIISSVPYPPQNGLASSPKRKKYPISQRINQGKQSNLHIKENPDGHGSNNKAQF